MQKVFERRLHLSNIDSMTHPVVLDNPVMWDARIPL
jgi:hypothetical protein